jgi:YVTN family beta-propeller protein
MRNGLTSGLPVLALAAIVSCGDDSAGPGSTGTDYDSIDPIVFTEHVQPILDANCGVTGCHAGAEPQVGLDLTSHDGLVTGSHHGSVVIPFHPERSHFYLHVSGEVPPRMPFERDPLDEAVVGFFERWITEGAKYDDGVVMYEGVSRKAFVACQGDNLVAVLDMDPASADRGRVIRLLDVDAPHSVHVHAQSSRLYVSRFETATDNIHVYDTDSYELVATGRAGTFPALMDITPDGAQLWVTNFTGFGDGDNAVRILDPTTLAEIVVGGITPPNVQQPHGLAIAPSGSFVYVANILSDDVSVFSQSDPFNLQVVKLPLWGGSGLQQPQQCILSPDEEYLYVTAQGSNRVYVMRTSDHTFVESATVEVGEAPWHLAHSPVGARPEVWVANWFGESVTVINVANPESPVVAATLAPMGPMGMGPAIERPIGIAFTPDGSRVYVANANDDEGGSGHHPPPTGTKEPGSVAIFDADTREVLMVTEVPNFARFISFLP